MALAGEASARCASWFSMAAIWELRALIAAERSGRKAAESELRAVRK
jgi:hypothetical protein